MNGLQDPDTASAMRDLAISYTEAGRHQEAITLLEETCELDPKNTDASLTLATWEAWFGLDAEYETIRRHLVQKAEGTEEANTAYTAPLRLFACGLPPTPSCW